MKIGFSLSGCVASIINNEVQLNDVLLIIANTKFETESDLNVVTESFWKNSTLKTKVPLDHCLVVVKRLYNSSRIYQPRLNANHNILAAPRGILWMDVFPTQVDANNKTLTEAWENYRMVLALNFYENLNS